MFSGYWRIKWNTKLKMKWNLGLLWVILGLYRILSGQWKRKRKMEATIQGSGCREEWKRTWKLLQRGIYWGCIGIMAGFGGG